MTTKKSPINWGKCGSAFGAFLLSVFAAFQGADFVGRMNSEDSSAIKLDSLISKQERVQEAMHKLVEANYDLRYQIQVLDLKIDRANLKIDSVAIHSKREYLLTKRISQAKADCDDTSNPGLSLAYSIQENEKERQSRSPRSSH